MVAGVVVVWVEPVLQPGFDLAGRGGVGAVLPLVARSLLEYISVRWA
jgi:hypothetical protein